MFPMLPTYFDSAETREAVLDDAEVYVTLLRWCGYDMTAVNLSLTYMQHSVIVWVQDDIREKRERKVR